MGIAISDHHSHGGRGLSAKQATDISRCPDKLDNFNPAFFPPRFCFIMRNSGSMALFLFR